MSRSWRNIVISLAGICQATHLVDQLAKTGYLKTEEFEVAVKSLCNQNPDSTESVFGSAAKLRLGLENLIELLNNHRAPKNTYVLRYVLGVIHLQKRLMRNREMLEIIGTRIETANRQAEHFGISHDNVIANIAEIYTDTISKLPYRIQVSGDHNYLQQQRVANQVRVLLFAGIRATMLWRQNTGSRWQLLFYRKQIAETAQSLLDEIKLH